MATGLNNLGQVVGYSTTVEGETHAFLWDPFGGMLDLGSLDGGFSRAFGVNDAGQVVGFAFTAEPRQVAFLWTAETGMVALESPQGWAEARAINASGVVTGLAGMRPVRWLPGEPARELGYVFGEASTWAIDGTGRIAGASDYPAWGGWSEAVLWNPDSTLVTLGAWSEAGSVARGLNDSGEVVGQAARSLWDSQVACLWTPEREMIDLNAYAPSGWTLRNAAGINARGDIVGTGHDGEAYQAYVLWKSDVASAESGNGWPEADGSAGDPARSTDAPDLSSSRLLIRPNPAGGHVTLELRASAPGVAYVEVFDLSGRLLATVESAVPAGDVSLRWEPRGDDGRGIRLVRVREPGGRILSGRVLVLPPGR